MANEPINVLTGDLSKFFTNSPSDLYDYMENKSLKAVQDELYSSDEHTFSALCISGYNSTGPGLIGKVLDSVSYSFGFNTFEKHSIKFRFYGDDEYRNGVLSQDPLDPSLTEEQKQTYVSLCRNAIVTEHNLIPEYGDIMIVRISSEGKYFVEKVVGNINKPTAPPNPLLKRLKDLLRNSSPLGDIPPYGVEQFDPTTLPDKDYDITISPATPWTENRVFLGHYGSMPCTSKVVTETGYGKSAHVLVVKRLKLLQEAFVKDVEFSGGEPFKVTSGCRPHRWRSREHYEQEMVRQYGSVKEGRKWQAYKSPHESSLAIDIKHLGKKPHLLVSSAVEKSGQNRRSPAFKWLKANAHRWGFTPYKNESWHWELKIPYNSWKNGTEFVDETVANPNYAVRVSEKKKRK